MFCRWYIRCMYPDVYRFVVCALVGYLSYFCVRVMCVDVCDVVISMYVRDVCQCDV